VKKRIFEPDISNIIQAAAVVTALVLGIVNLIRGCAQDDLLQNLGFQNTSLQHRPLVKVLRSPEIVDFNFRGEKTFAIKDLQPKKDSAIRTLVLPSELTVRFRLTLANVGTALAKIYLIASMDTTTGEDRIRQVLRSLQADKTDSSFFHNLELSQGDTTQYEFERTIQFFSNDKFTVHIFFLYANDFNSIYDTYYWARYRQKPVEALVKSEILAGQLVFRTIQSGPRRSDVLTLDTTNFSSKAYSREESIQIMEQLDRLASTLRK
jgi:hypothetical protein